MTRISLDSIESLRLPDLRALFTEVTGETTKSPNKKFLIRRIRETLAAQAAETAIAAETVIAAEPVAEYIEPANEQLSADEAAMTAELVTESAEFAEDSSTDEPAITEEPADATGTIEEPVATEEPTDNEDAATEAMEDEIESFATEADITEILEEEEMVAPDDDASDDEPAVESSDSGTKLSKLSVTELQKRYLEVVGRPTGSSHKRYLIWKIREAQKGRIPVGQRSTRSATPEGTDADIKILPLRMESNLVEQLDAARERLGLKSRMDLFRKALGAYMAQNGETELAAAFSTES